MAGQSIGELFIELFFKADTIKLKDFINSVGELNMSSIASSLGLAGLYDGLNKILTASSATAIGLHTFGAETGISTEKIDQFDNATRKAGLGADVFKNAVKGMQNKLTEMQLTGAGSGFLSNILGINPYEAIDEIDMVEKTINRIKEQFKPSMRSWAMGQAGLPSELLAVDFSKARQERFQSEDQTAKLMDYVKATTDLTIAIEALRDDIAVFIAPLITATAGEISKINKIGRKDGFWPAAGTLMSDAFQNLTPIGLGWKMMTAQPGAQVTTKNEFHIISSDPKEAARATYEEFKRHEYDAAQYQTGAMR